METLIQDIIVDLTESQNVVIFANQYDDDSRTVRCHIQDKGVDFDCSGYMVTLLMKKSNGFGISKMIGEDEFGSVSGNIIEFPILKEMTYSFGNQSCNFELKSGTKEINSSTFYLRVSERKLKQEDILDSDDYKSVHDQYDKLAEQITNVSSEVYTTNGEIPTGQKDGDYWTELL